MKPVRLENVQNFVDVARKTIAVVARRLHAGSTQPEWQFAMPEGLAIIERLARRLGHFSQSHTPFADRLTLAQRRSISGTRSVLDVAAKLYDIWRVVRMANPATAATAEARERMTKAIYA